MNCENCKFYERYYSYSKEYGFIYANTGKCLKQIEKDNCLCYGFKEENSTLIKKPNLTVESIIMETAIMCEEMNNKLKQLADLNKTDIENINLTQESDDRTTILFK